MLGQPVERLLELFDCGTELCRKRSQLREIEAIEIGAILPKEPLLLVRTNPGHHLAQRFTGEGVSPLVVGIVAAPHEPIGTDLCPDCHIAGSGLTDSHPHILGEVLTGQMTELVLVAVADLPGLAGLTDAVNGGVEILQ